MFLQSFSVSFNPTLTYFLGIFLLLNFHKGIILPQACISWRSIFHSSIYTKHLEYKWKAFSHMPMHMFFMFNPTSITNSLEAQISGSCWWPLSLQLCVTSRCLVLPVQSPLDWTFTPQRKSSPSTQQLHEAASENSKQPLLSQSHRAAAPQTELWETKGFFYFPTGLQFVWPSNFSAKWHR